MKQGLFTLLMISLLSKVSMAQEMPVDAESKKITYSEVIEVPGVKKDDLYARAKAWYVTSTGGTKLALELEDKEAGKLLGKVNNSVRSKNPPMGVFEVGYVNYTITVIVKDEKYKYTFTDFNHESGGMKDVTSSGALENKKTGAKLITGGMPTQYQWGQIKKETDKKVQEQITSLKKALAATGKKEDDF